MVLDEQILFNRDQSLLGMALWLVRKWVKAVEKKAELESNLKKLREDYTVGLSDEELRAEWKKQVEAQTKPLDRKHLSILEAAHN